MVSSHADTIRRFVTNASFAGPPRPERAEALDALDALLAELALSRSLYDELFAQTEQLRGELERQFLREPYLELTQARAENQRLRDALNVVIICCERHGAVRSAVEAARDALDGTPSAAQTLEDTQ